MTRQSNHPAAPPPPRARVALGITGHRESNPAYAANRDRIASVLHGLLDRIAGHAPDAMIRLHTLLADGADQFAAHEAIDRGWELVVPLPFGPALNRVINAHPPSVEAARAALAGDTATDPGFAKRLAAIDELAAAARVFSLADADGDIVPLFLATLAAPENTVVHQRYSVHASERVALAGQVVSQQSDILIAVWDGLSRAFVGGTGHTIATGLEHGAPVVLIDANAPEQWHVLRSLEGLAGHGAGRQGEIDEREAILEALVRQAAGEDARDFSRLDAAWWKPTSNLAFHTYRRIETLFGGGPRKLRSLRQTYETPDSIGKGTATPMLAALAALPGGDPALPGAVESAVLRRFAWADGISARLSDLYRGGMIGSFLASGLAIVAGVAYLPFAPPDAKWLFALAEFLLLLSILVVTTLGRKRGWHAAWFETRRAAEYLRHAPMMLALGVARPARLWPRGAGVSWPEFYARQSLRAVGLPRAVVTKQYLRAALSQLLDRHIVEQRDYHRYKAGRLMKVHHNLDRFSALLFQLAVVSVAAYLLLRIGAAVHLVPHDLPHDLSKLFTFLGVLFPTFGGAIAGIRYFGDFDRFGAISAVSAEKLDAVHLRAQELLAAPDAALDYGAVADLAQVADQIVVSEIENWQAVFAGKHITVPV